MNYKNATDDPKHPTIERVRYRPARTTLKDTDESVTVIGIDTEADRTGRPFMVATSEGDAFSMTEWPQCLFTRRYRGKTFVAYNLKYDSGAFVRHLPKDKLKALWSDGKVVHDGYTFKAIGYKCMIISRGKNSVTFYDMLNFYHTSLSRAAEKYLGKSKLDQDVELYTPSYIEENWPWIAEYCIRDAELVKALADRIIAKFEAFGVKPRKLYSVAYVSYEYFRRKTLYPSVKRYWHDHRKLLGFAMRAYQGGKFEVTEKGIDKYYEYDIVSAYPYEIANLIDVTHARVEWDDQYHPDAVYGFLDCTVEIPYSVHSPLVATNGYLNWYPMGTLRRTITKTEYEHMTARGCEITIHEAVWLHQRSRFKPFEKEIHRLVKLKQQIKQSGDELDYHTIKILLNSLYGKFVQLIKKKGYWQASGCWNPIYGAVITANCRCRISDMQDKYTGVVAVHTDSIISLDPLPFPDKAELGGYAFERSGEGVILGSGIYQIGDVVKFRGFDTSMDLWSLIDRKSRTVTVKLTRPYTWRSVGFFGWDTDLINRFTEQDRRVRVDFDTKRFWIDDWRKFSDVRARKVESTPRIHVPFLL